MLEAIKYDVEKNTLSILDQRVLPKYVIYEDILTVEQGWEAIATMKVFFDCHVISIHYHHY